MKKSKSKENLPEPPKFCSYCGSQKIEYSLYARVERDKVDPVAFWSEIPFYYVDCKGCSRKYNFEPRAIPPEESYPMPVKKT